MISIHFLVLTACLAASVCFGFFAGKLWTAGNGGETAEDEAAKSQDKRIEKKSRGWSVGSPVSGQVLVLREGPDAEVVIQPEEDKLYAPVGGKITKLYPLGNAFRFRTEFGAELYIQVCDVKDEMLGRYYRPRVIQNEIVNKGKLLLEFDRQGLREEGVSSEISVRVDHYVYGSDVLATAQAQVRTGEEILWLQEVSGQPGFGREQFSQS